jgi:spore germination cell wall hydrolase CwlJ-like protein
MHRFLLFATVVVWGGMAMTGYFDDDFSDTPSCNSLSEFESEINKICPDDVMLLARLVNSEAAGESFTGQLYVANVVFNRMMWKGQTLREVIYARKQFSGVKTERFDEEPHPNHILAAKKALRGEGPLPLNVLYFCNPETSTNKKFVKYCLNNLHISVNNHIFAVKN